MLIFVHLIGNFSGDVFEGDVARGVHDSHPLGLGQTQSTDASARVLTEELGVATVEVPVGG